MVSEEESSYKVDKNQRRNKKKELKESKDTSEPKVEKN